jgi:enamine deaminase RidA (YjgF/YER057c/UK114 family)
VRPLLPPGWPPPKGFVNGIVAEGRLVFVAGQVGWDSAGVFAPDLPGQVRQALLNIVAVLAEADARPEHIARMTRYITSREEYLAHPKEIGAAYRDVMGNHFPAMAVVQVVALVEAEARVEIEATAVLELSATTP